MPSSDSLPLCIVKILKNNKKRAWCLMPRVWRFVHEMRSCKPLVRIHPALPARCVSPEPYAPQIDAAQEGRSVQEFFPEELGSP
jgi:hypothetical protein